MDTSSTSTSYTQDVVDYDDDRNLDEVFRMYGIKAALDNSNSNDDCQSEVSDDLEERLTVDSSLFVHQPRFVARFRLKMNVWAAW